MTRGLRAPGLRRRSTALVLVSLAALLVLAMIAFAARVQALRAQRATGPNWTFPSRVFSNGVPLVPGAAAPERYLENELAARDYRRARVADAPGAYATLPDGFEIVLRGFPDEPDPEGSGGPERVRVHLVAGRIGSVERLGGLAGAPPPDTAHPPRLEPVLVSWLFDEERIWRSQVSLARVPRAVQDVFVASEDRRFRTHAGVDVRGLARALRVNLRAGGVREGGSTITQQLARGLFLGRERTLVRKLAEVPLALGLEILLSKDQILEMYLNSAYWGQARGFAVGGIAEASRWFFDQPVESLTVLQAATLAAMIPAPNALDPFAHPAATLEHRNRVLEVLVETRQLDAAEAVRLQARPLGLRQGPAPVERFPSYSGYVRDVVDRALRRRASTHFGLSIFTSMDLAWQGQAEEAIESGLAALDASSRRRDRLEGAFVALDPSTRAVVAMVGGRRMATGAYNRATMARRQTGSAIKPIVYSAAFENGFTPATTVADTPFTLGRGRSAWRPRNFGDQYHAEVTLAKALEMSLNVATTRVVERVGPEAVAAEAERFGLGRLKPVMSIGLGSNETTLLDLVNAFAVFPSRGMLRAPSPLRAVVDRERHALAGPPQESSTALPLGIAALMTGLLENVTRYGVAAPLRSTYGFDRPVAGKTGTTDEFRDTWFVGFTPDLVAGTWVGYDRPRSIGRQAAHTALPLWARAMSRMLEGFPPTPFATDAELEWVNLDPWRGCLGDSLSAFESVPFLRGTAPTYGCQSAWPDEEEYESADSAFNADTSWSEAGSPGPPPVGEPRDTATEVEPDTLIEEPR